MRVVRRQGGGGGDDRPGRGVRDGQPPGGDGDGAAGQGCPPRRSTRGPGGRGRRRRLLRIRRGGDRHERAGVQGWRNGVRVVPAAHRDGNRPRQRGRACGGKLPFGQGCGAIQRSSGGSQDDQGGHRGAGLHCRAVGRVQRRRERERWVVRRSRKGGEEVSAGIFLVYLFCRAAARAHDGTGKHTRGSRGDDDGCPRRRRAGYVTGDGARGVDRRDARAVLARSTVLHSLVEGAAARVGEHGPPRGNGHVRGVRVLRVRGVGRNVRSSAGQERRRAILRDGCRAHLVRSAG